MPMKTAVASFRAGVAGIAMLSTLLGGCASAPHKMGDPFEGLGIKPAPSRTYSLRHLAHRDIALVRSKNTRAVMNAVDVYNGHPIMFNEGALPKSRDYDFAEQIASATAELFKDRFGKVVDASSLDDAARKGMSTAAILDLQVYDSNPTLNKRGYFFRSRLAVYLVDVKTREPLGEAAVTRTLKLPPAELEGDPRAVTERENKLLNQALAESFFSLANELDPRLGTTQKPLTLPAGLSTPAPGPHAATAQAPQPAESRHARKNRRQLTALAKKLRNLDDLRAYGMITDAEYDARKRDLLHKYRRYLN
jgi:hypothetical protein